MTAHSTLMVRTPADFLAAVPYLIGFHPADSVVVVGIAGQKVLFAARSDLPPPADEPSRAAAVQLAEMVARQAVDEVTVIGYGAAPRVTPTVLRLGDALRRRDVRVLDLLRVTGGRYWSYLCDESGCCPEDGTPYSPEHSVIAAQATYAGAVVLPDRDALMAQFAPVTGAPRELMVAATERAEKRLAGVPEAEFARYVRRTGRAFVREAGRRYRADRVLTDDEAAWLGVLLADTSVRDYAWDRVGVEESQLRLWTDVLRRVEPAYIPAVASLLGFTAWRQGLGAHAQAAVDRALAVDQDCRMALLLAEILKYGLPPSAATGRPPSERRNPRRRRRRRSGR
jgi:hypothetical protein